MWNRLTSAAGNQVQLELQVKGPSDWLETFQCLCPIDGKRQEPLQRTEEIWIKVTYLSVLFFLNRPVWAWPGRKRTWLCECHASSEHEYRPGGCCCWCFGKSRNVYTISWAVFSVLTENRLPNQGTPSSWALHKIVEILGKLILLALCL